MATLLLVEEGRMAAREEQQMCVILPEAKQCCQQDRGFGTKDENTEACNAVLQHPRAGWWPAVGVGERKRSRGYVCHQDTRKGFYFFSSKCLQFPISLSWVEASCRNCTPDLQQEAVQNQDSGEQQRYPLEVPRLKWDKALRLWWNEVSAVLGWIRNRMCKS